MLTDSRPPQFLLRMGSHAERYYFEWASQLYDTLVFNANLVEGTPAACVSLVESLLGGKPYIIDPVSHAFALRISYLQSEKVNRRTQQVTVSTKRTFAKLAERYGEPFVSTVGTRPLIPSDFDDPLIRRNTVERVLIYQMNRLEEERPEHGPLRPSIERSQPVVLVAPYFFIESASTWRSTNLALAGDAVALQMGLPVYAVLSIDRSLLQDLDTLTAIAEEYCKSQVDGFFVWVSDLVEQTIGKQELGNFIDFLKLLSSDDRPIYNMFGGYLSALLRVFGMTGLCHGPGYGEHRSIVPVLGGGVPPAKYYLPPLHQTFVLADAESILAGLSTDEYYNNICSCPVCRNVIGNDFQGNFQKYGELELKGVGKRGQLVYSQTPNSVRFARGHYLVARFIELQQARTSDIRSLTSQLHNAELQYRHPSGFPATGHLRLWADEILARLPS